MRVIKGYVEAIRAFQVRGWACDTTALGDVIDVTLTVGGEVLATGRADVFRADLAQSGLGNGRHGFILNLERKLTAAEQTQVVVTAGLDGDGLPQALIRMPDAMLAEPVQNTPTSGEVASPIKGFVTLITPTELKGWALDSDQPNDHVMVEVLAGDRLLGFALADEFRPDLLVAMIGNGDHGFRMQIDPSSALNDVRSVTVRARSSKGAVGLLESLEADTAEQKTPPTTYHARRGLSFAGPDVDQAQRPVFILGAARSGTSALAQALVRTTRYEGHEEGHLLDLLGPLFRTIKRHYEDRGEEWKDRQTTLIASVPKEFLESGVRHIFVELARSLFPKGWWVDKTPRPEMIAVAPLLKEIWPEACFIFLKRRGIENIASRMRKFPAMAFEQHCRDWYLGMQGWIAVRGLLAGSAVEVDQAYLATQPEKVVAVLSSMLLLQPDEMTNLTQALVLDRPERTSDKFAAVESLSAIDWSPEQKTIFLEICGSTMDDFGYGLEEHCFLRHSDEYGLVRK